MNQDKVDAVWAREERRQIVRDKAIVERAKIIRLGDGGKDGTVLTRVSTRITNHRVDKHTVRSRPGTFEWRYGRNTQSALYHAGNQFARLWETAGIAIASSANFLRGIKAGYSIGLSEGRISAIDKLAGAVEQIGHFSTERLIDYCVLGLTTSEIARKNDQAERDMAAVIHADLRSCAVAFRFT